MGNQKFSELPISLAILTASTSSYQTKSPIIIVTGLSVTGRDTIFWIKIESAVVMHQCKVIC